MPKAIFVSLYVLKRIFVKLPVPVINLWLAVSQVLNVYGTWQKICYLICITKNIEENYFVA